MNEPKSLEDLARKYPDSRHLSIALESVRRYGSDEREMLLVLVDALLGQNGELRQMAMKSLERESLPVIIVASPPPS